MNLKNCGWELKDYKWGRGHTSRPTLWTDHPGSQWGQGISAEIKLKIRVEPEYKEMFKKTWTASIKA